MTRRDPVAESSIMPERNIFSTSQRETGSGSIPVGWDNPLFSSCHCRSSEIAITLLLPCAWAEIPIAVPSSSATPNAGNPRAFS